MKGDEGLSEGSLFPTPALVSPILVLSKPYDQGKFVVKVAEHSFAGGQRKRA